MDGVQVKQELIEHFKPPEANRKPEPSKPISVIDLSSSDSDSDVSTSSSDDDSVLGSNGKRSRVSSGAEKKHKKKKKKMEELSVALPVGFLDPLPPKNAPLPLSLPLSAAPKPQSASVVNASANVSVNDANVEKCKQFWKAGDYVGAPGAVWDTSSGGMDHVRVHPKFLHSNATSHKWVLGAFAELLDNSLDEVCHGATFVNIDMLRNNKDGSRMLLIEDNGGGMDPDKMRQCMSLGYSVKSKVADTIGQYGNGFKTSTMRLGADVIVFSRCCGQDGKRPTQSIGLLSYMFLRSTGKEDIVVPMSYASILYLRIPPGFHIILRRKDVEHHNVVNDMMMTQELTYRPQPGTDAVPKDSHIVAVVTIGFVKDAKAHIDVQGFNVFHKNRLIKPFWRLWNAAGSDGRGVIGVLEANFVEPAHDKQGFERTIVLSRLEARLVQMQKTYWSTYCHKIGYAPRRNKKHINNRETSPDYLPQTPSQSKKKNTGSSSKIPISVSDKLRSHSNQKEGRRESERYLKTMDKSRMNGHLYTKGGSRTTTPEKSGKIPNSSEPSSPSEEDVSDDEIQTALPDRQANCSSQKELPPNKSSGKHGSRISRSSLHLGNTEAEQDCALDGRPVRMTTHSQSKGEAVYGNEFSVSDSNSHVLDQLKAENRRLTERLKRKEEEILSELLHDLDYERDRCKSLETKLEEATRKIGELNKEQESLIDIFSEERERRDIEEENLRKKLKDASNTIQELLDKLRLLEKKSPSRK